jgi:ferric-dicitrate binding protein FerR (iron transport regulator)
LLDSVTWDASDLPELAAQATALVEEARRRAAEQSVPALVRTPGKPREARPRTRPGAGAQPAAMPRMVQMGLVAAGVLVLAGLGTWYVRGRNVPGYVELTAAPWGEVASVSNAKGEHLNITGETPLQVALPAGHYVIELRNGRSSCKVEAAVERGSVSAYSCAFPEVKVDDLVQKILSAN